MSLATFGHDEDHDFNPLDIVEHFVLGNDWMFERGGEEEIAVQVPGQWTTYSLYFSWRPELGAVHFSCAFDIKIPASKKQQINELLATINEKMWLGHFSVWAEESILIFRHAVLIRNRVGLNEEIVEDLIDLALSECEKFYPAFQFVIWGGKSVEQALAGLMLETIGEA